MKWTRTHAKVFLQFQLKLHVGEEPPGGPVQCTKVASNEIGEGDWPSRGVRSTSWEVMVDSNTSNVFHVQFIFGKYLGGAKSIS